MSDAPQKSALENRIDALKAVYHRYGAEEGLKGYSLEDASLLLATKQLELRDTPRDGDKLSRRLLELEVRDLGSYVDSRLAAAGLPPRPRGVSREQVDAEMSRMQGRDHHGRGR